MFRRLREIYYVSWADLAFMKHNILNVILMSLMSPILYLIAFGYGLGGSATDKVRFVHVAGYHRIVDVVILVHFHCYEDERSEALLQEFR